MRALSLTQPWAWSMVHGPKRIENRTWPVPEHLIGQTIAVHASAKWDKDGEAFLLERGVLVPPRGTLARGAYIGVATIVRCVEKARYDLLDEVARRELVPDPVQDDYFFGPFGQLWENVRPITPLLAPGALSFFEVSEADAREIALRLNEPADTLPTPATLQQGMPWGPHTGYQSRRGKRRK